MDRRSADRARPSERRLSRRRLLALGAIGLASGASGLLAACQPAPAQPAASKPAAPAGAAAEAKPAAAAQSAPASPVAAAGAPAAPKPGGTLIVASGSDPGPMENSINLGSDTQRYLIEIYDRLVLEDLSADAPSAPLVPGLATKWTTSPDGLQYTFTLRPNVKFHDGTPFSAEAVKFNVERLTQPNHPFYYERGAGATKIVYGRVASVEVIDPLTVRFQLSQPYANFSDVISLPIASFASPEVIKQYGNNDHPAHASGTGAFKFVEAQKGTKFVMARNPDYWGGPPPLDQVVVRPITEPTAAVSALLAGEVHLITTAKPDSIELLKARPDIMVKNANVPLTYCWNFNVKEKPFDDKRVRQALNWALDRETYCKDILKGLAVPAKSVFGPSMTAYDASLKGYSYDPDKAKALLKEVGLDSGFSFKMQTAKGQGHDQLALYVKDQLAKINVNVEVELFELQTFSANANKDGTQPGVGAVGWSWNCNPPFNFDRFFTSSFGPPNGVNFGFYSNPEVDATLGDVAKTIDRDERMKLYRKLDAMVTEDAAWLFAYHPIEPRAYTSKLTWVSANSNWYTLRNASLG